jgi:glc operon protein GlcG
MSGRLSKVLVLSMGGFIGALMMGGTGQAQLLDRKAISLAEAKKLVAAAMAEAVKNKWQMVVVVADDHGTPIVLEKMDGVQLGSVGIAERKAKTSALLRRPTKALEDAVMGNPGAATPPAPPRNTLLTLFPDFLPIGGGLPLFNGDQLMGAIGCSGGTAAQDEQVCKAGVDAMGK